MANNYDVINISSDRKERAKVLCLIEEVCDKFNLHNYFGIFSVVVDEVLDLIFKNEVENTEISFEQCIGGVCFSVNSDSVIFTEYSELIEMLTNEYNILNDGQSIELIFYVNGIDTSELTSRQNNFKEYFRVKGNNNNVLSSKRKTETSSI